MREPSQKSKTAVSDGPVLSANICKVAARAGERGNNAKTLRSRHGSEASLR